MCNGDDVIGLARMEGAAAISQGAFGKASGAAPLDTAISPSPAGPARAFN